MNGGGDIQETPDQIVEQTNNTKLFNYYQKAYKPFIDKTIKQTTARADSPADANRAAGQVNAEVMKGASVNTGQPGQGNPISMTRQLDNAASIGSQATTTAQGKVRQLHDSGLQNIVDIGRGQQTTAQAGQEALASQSLNAAIANKQTDMQTDAAIENGIGSAVGIGAAAGMRYMKDPAVGTGMNQLFVNPDTGGYSYNDPNAVGPRLISF